MSDQERHPNGSGRTSASSSKVAEKEDIDAPASESIPARPEPPSYPPPLVFGINMVAMYIAVFCVALDNTILSTAIPQITDQFHALDDVGWYGSAYTLTQCVFTLLFGKLYTIFSPKWTFLGALFVFEVGSLICGVAPTSVALIIGRAIAGVGAAGVFAGVLVIITHTSPLEKRPIWQGLISGMFGIASVIGPLMGGVFTDKVTWRWCFYINLPLGGITAAIIIFFLHLPARNNPLRNKKPLEMLWLLDPLGLILFLPSMICLFLALQWGGTTYAWSNWRVVACFVVFGILLMAFAGVEWRLGEGATIPVHIVSQRTIWSASWFAFFLSGAFFLFVYFIPIYFQAIKGTTALRSSIDNLPLILANVILAVLSGVGVSKLGYINPFCLTSVVFAAIGSGLLMTMTADTSTGKWIGYQLLFGIGSGLGFQQPPNAPQTVLPFKDLPRGIAITLFSRNLGASLFISTGNNLLNSELLSGLTARALSGVDPEAVVAAGATEYQSTVPSSALGAVVDVYVKALQKTFRVGVIISCIAIIGAALIEWKSVRVKKGPPASKRPENDTVEKARNGSS